MIRTSARSTILSCTATYEMNQFAKREKTLVMGYILQDTTEEVGKHHVGTMREVQRSRKCEMGRGSWEEHGTPSTSVIETSVYLAETSERGGIHWRLSRNSPLQ